MATNLTKFLFSLSDDPNQLQAFKQNPKAVMTAAGLNQTEQNLILNGDVQGVHQHLLADPDLNTTMGITPGSPHPKKLPTCIFMVPKPQP